MNIFILDRNPLAAVCSLADHHVIPAGTDTACMLSAVLIRGGCALSKTFPRSSCIDDTFVSSVNTPEKAFWLFSYFENLLNECEDRFNTQHQYARLLHSYGAGLNFVYRGIMSTAYNCDGLTASLVDRTLDTVDAYRAYYKELRSNAESWRYTNRQEPEWLK